MNPAAEGRSSRGEVATTGSAGRSAADLDAVDRRILAALAEDSRISVRALAERLHLSRAGAYARIERLRERGVITGFTISIDPATAGLTTTAYVAINIEQNTWRAVSAALAELAYLDRISLMGSEFDVLVQVHAPDNAALRTLVLERIQAIPGVIGTRTWLVFDEIPGRGRSWAD
ncbi:Lrp/AsnC family transcriptional regulator [Calidifontibacter indicus]|uniref:AsnC family transcriptional regulator n=1 Tax=Calidifontibacter indicus TaxID=419650 RepID=A0A3D9UIP0_9MICO|nr:Lrp/AsnC family transcriptional regulator [Calidifontibacter indicus]REF29189.1 AsnC family transcriptional regulator [Calidifontibacter indicus]